MSRNTDTLKREAATRPAQPLAPTTNQIREALARLREAGEKLPSVDAVAVVRAGREIHEQERG